MIDFVLLGAIWGASFLFTRIAVVEFGALPTAGVRVAVAALFLLPLLWLRGLGPQLRRHWKAVFLTGVLNSAIPFACFSFALLSLSTGQSAILNATVPLFGALVAWLWLKDRLTMLQVLGLVIGFGGIALLVTGGAAAAPAAGPVPALPAVSNASTGWAVAACLLATLCYGISASVAKRYLGGLPALVTATGSQLGATLGLMLPAWWFWPQAMPGLRAWLALVVVGVVCTALAYILYFRIIEQAGPTRALAVTFLVPVFAVVYGSLFLGESVSGWMLFCAAIIVCGTALSTRLIRLPAKAPATRTTPSTPPT